MKKNDQKLHKLEENNRLLREELQLMREVHEGISIDMEPRELIRKIVSTIYSHINVDIFNIGVINGNDKMVINDLMEGQVEFSEASSNFYQPIMGVELDYHTSPLWVCAAAREKKVIYYPQIIKADFPEPMWPVLDKIGLRACYIAPITIGEKVLGALLLGMVNKPLILDDMDLELIESRLGLIARVIENSRLYEQLRAQKEKIDTLMLNILPAKICRELEQKGQVQPVLHKSASVLFTDFVGFTQISETMAPEDLIRELDLCFSHFDSVAKRYKLEKIKTIGDSYMCAAGIPEQNPAHFMDVALAALEIRDFMARMKGIREELGFDYWDLRIGIHTGSLIAGVIGENKFSYDIWGDTVNLASRMESSGIIGEINISQELNSFLSPYFISEFRGKVPAKNKGEVEMFLLKRLKEEYSLNREGKVPNEKFWNAYQAVSG